MKTAAVSIFILFFVSFANAETVTLKKSLIWSGDDSSDYKLPKPQDGLYAPEDFIAASGRITGITVNWRASGKINFKVSADNGLNYTQAINGVPLKAGFTGGDRIRWRAQALGDDAKLSRVDINYTDASGVSGNFGEPCLSGFLYRKAVIIKNPLSEELYNYQLKLKIAENEPVKNTDVNLSGHSLADLKDIRFTAADAQTPLPYYIETVEGETGSRVITAWVRVAQIPKTGVTIYLYYGNGQAQGLSDPNAVFDFYEDFSGASLSKDKWVLHTEQKGSATLSRCGIKLDAAEILSKEFKFKEGIIEYSCVVESGLENSLNIRNKNEASYESPVWLAYSSIYKGAEHCIAVDGIVKANDAQAKLTIAGQNYNYRVNLDKGKITFERFKDTAAEPQARVTYNIQPAPKAGYLSLRSGGDGGGKNVICFGAIRARKGASILPVIESTGEEETVVLPVFVNTRISGSGSVALKNGAKSGYYISRDIAIDSPLARIIVPDWSLEPSDGTTIAVNVSTDKGLTYIKGCEKSRYYYASKKDFTPGDSLKARVDFFRGNTKAAGSGLSTLSLDYRPGKISVISPNGGEHWPAGTREKITWLAGEYEDSYPFNIEYSVDGGKNYTLIAGQVPNSGTYLWSPAAESKNMRVKVADANDADIFDASDNTFSAIGGQSGSAKRKL